MNQPTHLSASRVDQAAALARGLLLLSAALPPLQQPAARPVRHVRVGEVDHRPLRDREHGADGLAEARHPDLALERLVEVHVHRRVEDGVDLPPERDLEEGEEEEPHEAVDEVEDEDLDDQPVLVGLHRAVVLKVGERARDLVEDDPVEQLERDAPDRRVAHVEDEGLPQRHLCRLDPKVAKVEHRDEHHDEEHLRADHHHRHRVLERAAPLRVRRLELAGDRARARVAVELLAHDLGLLAVEHAPLERQPVGAALPHLAERRRPDRHERREERRELLHLLRRDERERKHEGADERRPHQPRGVVRVEGVVEGDLLAVLAAHVAQELVEARPPQRVDALRLAAQQAVEMAVLQREQVLDRAALVDLHHRVEAGAALVGRRAHDVVEQLDAVCRARRERRRLGCRRRRRRRRAGRLGRADVLHAAAVG